MLMGVMDNIQGITFIYDMMGSDEDISGYRNVWER